MSPQTKVIQDSKPRFGINPDSDQDICRITPKILCFYYVVGVSHFAEYHENMSVTVWEMLINLLKVIIPQWRGRGKSDLKSVSGTGLPPKVNQFFRSVDPSIQQGSMKSADYFCSNPAHRQTDRQTDSMTGKPMWSHIIRLGGGKNFITELDSRDTATDWWIHDEISAGRRPPTT